MAALRFLTLVTSENLLNEGSSPILYGELLSSRGRIIAKWSLGAAIAGPPCLVRNPDGSIALGCFIRNF